MMELRNLGTDDKPSAEGKFICIMPRCEGRKDAKRIKLGNQGVYDPRKKLAAEL